MVRSIKIAFALGCMLLIAAIVFRTVTHRSTEYPVHELKYPEVAVSREPAVERLSKALQFPTITFQDRKKIDDQAFDDLISFMERSYPLTFKALKVSKISPHSRLLEWTGEPQTGERSQEDPLMFTAHLDVVPISPGTEKDWTHPPFSGRVADDYIWGRGALDMKSTAIALLESVEFLLGKGFKPKRTIYFSFGYDEEIGGEEGAKKITEELKNRGIKLAAVFDEGGFVSRGFVDGVLRPVGLIGIAEKGYLTLVLTAKSDGGHSSIPKSGAAIERLTHALEKIYKSDMPVLFDDSPVRPFLQSLAGDMPWYKKVVVLNLWLFQPILETLLLSKAETAAMIHTTVAPTILRSGDKDNVVPIMAEAFINFRIVPGDSVDKVKMRIQNIINDSSIAVSHFEQHNEPSAVSNIKSEEFKQVAASIQSVFPGTIVSPYLALNGTDSKHYGEISKNVFRFIPFQVSPEDVATIHSTNERISIQSYMDGIGLYIDLISQF